MSDNEQYIQDDSDTKKYFTIIPNCVIDDLAPIPLALYTHYRRVCGPAGTCWESVRTTAERTRMSVGAVVAERKALVEGGYITATQPEKGGPYHITIVDIWPKNMERYSRRSCDEHSVHLVNTGVHQVNQRRTIEEEPNEEKNAPRIETDKVLQALILLQGGSASEQTLKHTDWLREECSDDDDDAIVAAIQEVGRLAEDDPGKRSWPYVKVAVPGIVARGRAAKEGEQRRLENMEII